MDDDTKDLAIGAVGAVVLVVLVVALFYVGEAAPSSGDGIGDDGTDGSGSSPGNGTGIDYDNTTLDGTVEAGATIGGEGGSQDNNTFQVAEGTFELRIEFTFDTSQGGDLDCHLYDPNGTKHGDEHCHEGSADDPQGSSFTLDVNASQVGEWTATAHTGKSGEANLNNDIDYTWEIARVIER